MTASVLGVDGTRGGWLAVEAWPEGRLVAEVFPSIGTVLERRANAEVVAVDIPIGAPLAGEYPRAADVLARKIIGPLRSSVFFVPPREVLAAPTYLDASNLCIKLGVPGVSKQAFALASKILEVEAFAGNPRVREIHPEVSFAAMAGQPLRYGKKAWHGLFERLGLLRSQGLDPHSLGGMVGRAAVDDVLDAVAAAWTARRIAAGAAESLPPNAAPGAPAIWY